MSNPKDDFVEHLYQLERKVDAISNHPQLGNASVHGQQIDFYDRDNNRIGSIGGDNGLGFDYVDGPVPPVPAPPIVSADAGVIAVEWAGQWADGREPSASDPDVSRTRDLEGVEIHVSSDPLFEPDVVSMQGMFTSADGGSYAVGPMHDPGEYFVRLRARSRSGKVSAPSEAVVVEVAAALIDLQLAEMQVRTIDAQESADGKNRIFRGPTEPDPSLGPFNTGDTWFNTADSNMPSQWDGEQWASVADERVHALEQVQADLQEQIDSVRIDGAGNRVFRGPTEPTGAMGADDVWFKQHPNGDYEIHFRNADNTGWVPSSESGMADLSEQLGGLDSKIDLNWSELSGSISKAEADAIAQAKLDAQALADAARESAVQDATAAAAVDAQARADAAQAAADEAARAYAEAIATGIEPVDLDALRAHMDAKADQARQAAIDAAAIDAQARADAARQAAEAKAATAQQAADAAMVEAESKASLDYILSRGTDLVTNGTGYLGDNTNFPGSVFDPANAPTGARGAFDYEGSRTVILAEAITVDPNRRYLFRFMAKQENPNIPNSRFYSFVQPVDSAGLVINVQNYWYQPETKTTLAADLKPGDTTATIVGSWPSFPAGQYRNLAAWNYTDKWGKTWGYGTYTRNVRLIASVSGSTVTLNGAWSGPLIPAGTVVSTTRNGLTVMYIGATPATMPTEWATFSGSTQSGVHDSTTGAATTRFPPGTAAARLGFLLAHASAPPPPGEVSRSSIAMVSFSDVTQALQEGEQARAAADAAQAAAEAAHTAAGSAQSTADSALVAATHNAKNLFSTSPPSGVAPRGTLWFQHDSSGRIVGQWQQTSGSDTTTGSTWVKREVTSEVIANLDAGKIASGFIDAARIQAGSITIGKVSSLQSALDAKETPAGAQAKADAARSAAVSAAASDAQAKASTAQAAAEAAAQEYADMVASGAADDAIQAAAADAKAKADAAKQAAITAASAAAAAKYDPTVSRVTGWTKTGTTTIDGGKIAADTIAAAHIQAGAIGATAIAADAITAAHVQAGAIGVDELAANAVVAGKIAANAVTAREIKAGSITAESGIIASLDAGKITSGILDSDRIKAGSLVADTVLVPGSAGSTVIRDGAVTTEKIAAGAITAESGIIGSLDVGKVVTGELDGMFIKAGAITAEKIKAGAVTATALSADAINGKTITGATVRTSATGNRVQMDASGLKLFDSSNRTTADLSGAGLNIKSGGNIVIESGGSLDIRSGNLILGTGKIDGSALKEQIATAGIDTQKRGWSISSSQLDSWRTVSNQRIVVPAWATTAVVFCFGYTNTMFYDNYGGRNPKTRVLVSGAGGEWMDGVVGDSGRTDVISMVTQASKTHIFSVASVADFWVDVQVRTYAPVRAADNSTAHVGGIVLFTR